LRYLEQHCTEGHCGVTERERSFELIAAIPRLLTEWLKRLASKVADRGKANQEQRLND
jgi:hypothetical protein